MAYVIINPNSNTNPGDKYRVVEASDWTAYVSGARLSVAFAGSFDTYDEAVELRAKMNRAGPNVTPRDQTKLKKNLEEQIQEAYRNGPSEKYEDLKELKRDLFPND